MTPGPFSIFPFLPLSWVGSVSPQAQYPPHAGGVHTGTHQAPSERVAGQSLPGGQAPDSQSLEAEPALPPPLTQLCTARSARWDSGHFWALDTKQ